MINLGWRSDGLHVHYRVQVGWLQNPGATKWDLLQVGDGTYLIFGILHGQKIGVAAFRVDPVVGGDHAVGGQRRDYIIDHLPLRQSQLTGFLAVDVELECRIVHVLRDKHVTHAWEKTRLRGDFRGNRITGIHVVSADLNIDRRGQAQVEYGTDEATRLKVRGKLRKFLLNALLHSPHVLIASHLMSLAQTGLHEGRMRCGVRGVDRRKIGGDSDV